jgi:hypothetical protein
VAGRFGVRGALRWWVVGAVIAAVAALAPLVALADGGGRHPGERLLLGSVLRATGPTTTAGTFVASGAVRASGESTVEHLTVVPLGHHDRGRLSGTQTFTTERGTIVTRFRGVASAISTPHQWGEGRFRIVRATGDYAGLRGGGRFTIVVDLESNQLIGTATARVRD